jgi:MFS family permease
MRPVATELSTQPPARYRDVWAEPVFRVLFLSRSLGTTADTLRMLALSVLIYAATGSALLAALTYGISFLPQLLGGSLLGALTDRARPRALMTAGYIGEFASTAVLGLARLPVWGALTLVAAVSCLTPVFTGSPAGC